MATAAVGAVLGSMMAGSSGIAAASFLGLTGMSAIAAAGVAGAALGGLGEMAMSTPEIEQPAAITGIDKTTPEIAETLKEAEIQTEETKIKTAKERFKIPLEKTGETGVTTQDSPAGLTTAAKGTGLKV